MRHGVVSGPGHGAEFAALPGQVGGLDGHVSGLTEAACQQLCLKTSGCTAIGFSKNLTPTQCIGRRKVDMEAGLLYGYKGFH